MSYDQLSSKQSSKRQRNKGPSHGVGSRSTNKEPIQALSSPSATTLSHQGAHSPHEKSTLEDTETHSQPSNIWCGLHEVTPTTNGDDTTITNMVSGKMFSKVKFIAKDIDLLYSVKKKSVCQFVIQHCHLQADIKPDLWWREAGKTVAKTINSLRNNRNTAMKWAVMGKSKQVCNKTKATLTNCQLICCLYYILDWLREKGTTGGGKKKIVNPQFTIDDFLEGRANEEACELFFERFVPCATKKTDWQRRIAVAMTDIDTRTSDLSLCTISDEAFALLLLENSFDRWLDIFRKNKGEVTQQRGLKVRKVVSDVAPIYTKGGIKYDTPSAEHAAVKGWSDAGRSRFNKLYELVKQDRAKNSRFELDWLKGQAGATAKSGATKKTTKRNTVVQTVSELFSSDDDDDDDAAGDDISDCSAQPT